MAEITYELLENENGSQIVIRKNLDGSITSIPFDNSNSDYQEYLASTGATEPEAE